jgi:cell division septal protein FtsQ
VQPPDDEIVIVEADLEMIDDIGGSRDVASLGDVALPGVDIEVLDDVEVLDDDIEVLGVVELPADAAGDESSAAAQLGRPPLVDPRIRARRIAVAREQGRRRLRVLLVVLSVFVVVGTAWLLVVSPILDVDHIVVVGVPPERVAEVIAASGVRRGDPLLLVSTSAVAKRIEKVPGIGSVHVSRVLPGTLRISAREQGVALWARVPTGGVALVGYDGRVQRIAPAPPPNVIELRALTRVPAPGDRIPDPAVVDVKAELPAVFGARVGAISATSSSDVRLYLVSGGEVRLGDLSSVHDKGVVAEAVIERMGCPLRYVDVRSIADPVALPAPGASCNP